LTPEKMTKHLFFTTKTPKFDSVYSWFFFKWVVFLQTLSNSLNFLWPHPF
jgi:hypothetical protein